MIFNEDRKRYELTIEEVKANFEIPFNDDGVLEKRIIKNSKRVYSYIYRMCNSRNIATVEHLLNETDNGKRFLFDVLLSQMEADLETGFNSTANQPQIDLKTGRVIQEEDMIKNGLISIETKLIIESSPRYFDGLNILSAIPFARRY
jgi:hypothetical protein